MNAELYFEAQDRAIRERLWTFHRFILASHPGIRSTIKYGVPFYVLRKNLCYLCVQKGKIVLGIVDAHHQPEIHPFLDFTGRSQIGHFVWSATDQACFTDIHQVLTQIIDHDLSRPPKG